MRILIIRLSSLGDVVLASGVFSYLKKNNPEDEVYFATSPYYGELFEDDPRLSGVTGIPKTDNHTILSGLAAQSWGMIIDLQNSRRSRFIRKRYFPDVPARVFDKRHLYRYFVIAFKINRYDKNESVIRRYLRAAGAKASSLQEIFPATLYFNEGKRSKELLQSIKIPPDQPIIALFPFSAWRNKEWPMQFYSEVARYFIRKGWTVILMGSAEEIPKADKLLAMIGQGCTSLTGALRLHENGYILKHCALALGNDSGLSHVARACGVKTGIIYGATTRHFGFFPEASPAYAIFEARKFCRPCHAHGGNICLRLSRPCLKDVTVRQVIEGLEELINRD
jgi:heptosyltransferase-2